MEPEVVGTGGLDEVDLDLAERVTTREAGVATVPVAGRRPVTRLVLAVDAVDIPAVRPFWRAVLGDVDDPDDLAAGEDPARAGRRVSTWTARRGRSR
ncbi:hypothetical protein [Nakamurella leprariae]|uniref:Glyoxalase-like domain-containing protein n=1 Tax=Nakamurella leprariae TaxID=2803911 RepID=A0A939BYC8_9ACTN|nr:hypothetical protein [Nakamurella leprariae]MBM9469418.1 hypothetical protein [Nakamurella leprariae]